MKWLAVIEVSGCHWSEWLCAVKELLGVALAPETSLSSRQWRKTIPDSKSRPRKGLLCQWTAQGHWRPCAVARLSAVTISHWSLLLLLQHPRCRGCSGNAIRDVSGLNKWEFPPRHPSYSRSSVEPGRMTDAVAYQGQEWQLAPLSHIQRRIPQHCNTLGFSPKFLSCTHTKGVPCAEAIVLGRADYFKPSWCFHYRKMAFI